jgi:GNAT superfamily N-acetyltransferase
VRFIRVTPHDVPEVEAFLHARSDYVMFPLNNLTRFGLDGIDDLAPRMWRNGDGAPTDILSVTKAGMVMPYLPSGDFDAAAAALSGRSLIGIIGPKQAVRGMQAALGLATADMELDADEVHFALDFDDLIIPDGTTHIVPMTENFRPILTEWMVDYHINTLGMTPDAAADAVPDRISREIAENRRVILMDGDTPVAATTFNAALPHIVQIGAVYTPPALRGKGHARRAVALHLEQARTTGVRRATLFASAQNAIAAYTAVGFRQIGEWVLAIFKTQQVVP